VIASELLDLSIDEPVHKFESSTPQMHAKDLFWAENPDFADLQFEDRQESGSDLNI
jgi:hypothetical protein